MVGAHVYSGWTYDYFFGRHGWEGIDGANGRTITMVNIDEDNAFFAPPPFGPDAPSVLRTMPPSRPGDPRVINTDQARICDPAILAVFPVSDSGGGLIHTFHNTPLWCIMVLSCLHKPRIQV